MKSGEFDSALERNFAQEFEEKFGGQRSHWILKRETSVLLLGETVVFDCWLSSRVDPEYQRRSEFLTKDTKLLCLLGCLHAVFGA
jgi:hypothetical protein